MTNVIDIWTCQIGERFLVHFLSARAKEWADSQLPLIGLDKNGPINFSPDEYSHLTHALSMTGLFELGDETGVSH